MRSSWVVICNDPPRGVQHLPPVDLDGVADELYGLLPAQFVAARQARSGEARRAGDRPLAAAIQKLRRPTTGAWLANLLMRQRPDGLLQLLELGEAMRHAQAKLDAGDLRRLSRQRRQVVAELSREARILAGDVGQPVSDAVGRELEETLEAAFADADACEAVRSGRLTMALSYSGLGQVDVTGAVGGGAVDAGSPAPSTASGPATVPDDEVDRRRERSDVDAQQAVRTATTAVADAQGEAREQQRLVMEARDRVDLLRRQISDLEQQLQVLRDLQDQAGVEVRRAEDAQAEAERRVGAAEDDLARARAVIGAHPHG